MSNVASGYDDTKYYTGADGRVYSNFNMNQGGQTNHNVALGDRVKVDASGNPYTVGANGQPVSLGSISYSNNGNSANPVDGNGTVIDGKWQAARNAELSQYNSINGHTGGVAVNSEGYGAGAYDPYSISQANGFGTQFGAGKSGAAQMGDYSGAGMSLGQAAASAQQGNDDAYQQAALAQNYAVMNGAPSLGYAQGMQSLRAGADAQTAAAGTAMGGSLGQAAALRQNAQGAAGYNAQGQQALAAVQAQAQDQARQQYAAQLSGMRTSTQQGVNANQAIAGTQSQNAQDQAAFAQQQNALHDQASLYGQGLANQMKASNYGQQQKEADMAAEGRHAQTQYDNQEKKNEMQAVGAGIGAFGSIVGMGVSDMRAKEPLSLGEVAEMRLWR